MKYPSIVRKSKSKVIEYIATIPTVRNWQDSRINKNYGKYNHLNAFLKQVCCQYNVKEFELKQLLCAVSILIIGILVMFSIGWNVIISVITGVTAAFIAYRVPKISLKISYLLLKENIMSEINRFQATIIMCMHQDGVDVTSILNHLEMVAVYFKSSIAKVIDEYSGSGIESLEKLKYEEKHKSFIRIIDGLIVCDNISVSEAFEFIEKDREYDMQKREIQEARQLSNKVAMGKFISFIPMMTTICLKLILPFVVEGINRLETYSDSFISVL
jgi:hypothetical protein